MVLFKHGRGIYCIGKFLDIAEADVQADKMGLSPIWLLDDETAKNWRDKLKTN